MDKKSKILIWVFVILTAISVGYTFYKTVILQDFEIIDTSEEEVLEEDAEGTDTEMVEDDSVESESPEDLDVSASLEVDASSSEEITE